jgi:hypothetical protein
MRRVNLSAWMALASFLARQGKQQPSLREQALKRLE